MRKYIIILVMLCGCLTVSAQSAYEEYIAKYAPTAVSEMYRSGVPASITLAQGLLESAAGQSELASRGNNHFGIKCGGNWDGKTMYYDDDQKGECFRTYGSASESFKDHSDFLRYSKRYQSLFDLKITDYKGWAYGLKAAGYATDSAYPTKLIDLIEKYDLSVYDQKGRAAFNKPAERPVAKERASAAPAKPAAPEKSVEEEIPEAPSVLEQPVRSTFRFSMSRPTYEINGIPFVYAMEGETFASIAADYELFTKELLKFNDLKAPVELHPGDVVYIKAKANKAVRGLDKHVVESSDENIWEISQEYAVRMKKLQKKNKLKDGDALCEGEVLILR